MARLTNHHGRSAKDGAGIAALLGVNPNVSSDDIHLIDDFLAPGYGIPNDATLSAILVAARKEGLLVDPVYTGKVLAAIIQQAKIAHKQTSLLFVHTGGSPALFGYQEALQRALAVRDE